MGVVCSLNVVIYYHPQKTICASFVGGTKWFNCRLFPKLYPPMRLEAPIGITELFVASIFSTLAAIKLSLFVCVR